MRRAARRGRDALKGGHGPLAEAHGLGGTRAEEEGEQGGEMGVVPDDQSRPPGGGEEGCCATTGGGGTGCPGGSASKV